MKKSGHRSFMVVLILLIVIFFIVQSVVNQNQGQFSYSDLLKAVQGNNVESITIDYYGTSAKVKLKKADDDSESSEIASYTRVRNL